MNAGLGDFFQYQRIVRESTFSATNAIRTSTHTNHELLRKLQPSRQNYYS